MPDKKEHSRVAKNVEIAIVKDMRCCHYLRDKPSNDTKLIKIELLLLRYKKKMVSFSYYLDAIINGNVCESWKTNTMISK